MPEKSRTEIELAQLVSYRRDKIAAVCADGPGAAEKYLERCEPYMIRVLTDDAGALHFSFSVAPSPRIIVNTGLRVIEGIWGWERVALDLPREVCDSIDNAMKKIVPTIS